MEVLIVIACSIGIIMIVQGMKKYNIYLEYKYGCSIYNLHSLVIASLSLVGAATSYLSIGSWGIDNIYTLIIISIILLIIVLSINIKNTNITNGIFLTLIQYIVSIIIITFIICILSLLFSKDDKHNRGNKVY